MQQATLNIAPFFEKHRRMPETDRAALWTFDMDGSPNSFWGTLAEVSSTVSLYALLHDLEEVGFFLVDYKPAPRVFTVRSFEN